MRDDPLWILYWKHMSEVECRDAAGNEYMGYSARSWRKCDEYGCYYCDRENYLEEEAMKDGEE
jgi:hypothetical protein